ncbi:MAG: hypothetical protein ACJAVO_001455 [Parvibaculaceae bacterium]|jgi:hypothetical protein
MGFSPGKVLGLTKAPARKLRRKLREARPGVKARNKKELSFIFNNL